MTCLKDQLDKIRYWKPYTSVCIGQMKCSGRKSFIQNNNKKKKNIIVKLRSKSTNVYLNAIVIIIIII